MLHCPATDTTVLHCPATDSTVRHPTLLSGIRLFCPASDSSVRHPTPLSRYWPTVPLLAHCPVTGPLFHFRVPLFHFRVPLFHFRKFSVFPLFFPKYPVWDPAGGSPDPYHGCHHGIDRLHRAPLPRVPPTMCTTAESRASYPQRCLRACRRLARLLWHTVNGLTVVYTGIGVKVVSQWCRQWSQTVLPKWS